MEHKFSHISVLLYECIDALAIKPDGIYVDCALGGGGHFEGAATQKSGVTVEEMIDSLKNAIDKFVR